MLHQPVLPFRNPRRFFAAPTPLTQPVLKGCHPWPPSSETPLLAMIQLPCQPMRVLTSAAT